MLQDFFTISKMIPEYFSVRMADFKIMLDHIGYLKINLMNLPNSPSSHLNSGGQSHLLSGRGQKTLAAMLFSFQNIFKCWVPPMTPACPVGG